MKRLGIQPHARALGVSLVLACWTTAMAQSSTAPAVPAAPAVPTAPSVGVLAAGFPPTWQVDSQALVLNGTGRRLFSFLKLGIYDAGLYLPAKESDAGKILMSNGPKVMAVRMLRSGGVRPIREGWEESFKANCISPCVYPAVEVQRFLDAVPAAEEGAEKVFVFRPGGRVDIRLQGRPWQAFQSPEFSRLLLATWLGPSPPTPELKAGLLGLAPE